MGISLLDVAPATEVVKVRGGDLVVRGISAAGIAQLMGRFPEIGGLLSGERTELDADGLIALIPRAVVVLVAAGCGYMNDANAEAAVDNLTAEEQADVVLAVVRLTMPSGIGPFVEKLRGLMAEVGEPAAAPGKVPASS